jgi:hypothetical protein
MNEFTVKTDVSSPAYVAKFEFPKPNYSLTFHQTQDNGFITKEVGHLDFNGPAMKFEGDFEESAKVFFEEIARMFAGRLTEEYQRGYTDCLTEEAK